MPEYGCIRLFMGTCTSPKVESWAWYKAFIPLVSSFKPTSNPEKQQVSPLVLRRHQRSTTTSSEKQRPHRSLTTYPLPGQVHMQPRVCKNSGGDEDQFSTWLHRGISTLPTELYTALPTAQGSCHLASYKHCTVRSAGGADSASLKKRKAQGCTPNKSRVTKTFHSLLIQHAH